MEDGESADEDGDNGGGGKGKRGKRGKKKGKKKQKNWKKTGYGKTAELCEHPWLKPQMTIICGPTGSGKSQTALNMLHECLKYVNPKRLGPIYFYAGNPADRALKCINKDAMNFYGPRQSNSLITDLQKHQLQAEEISEESDDGLPLSFLILDDAGTSKELSPTYKGSFMSEIFMSHRHLGLHIIFMAQRFMLCPPFLRSNVSNMMVFPGKGKKEEAAITAELPFDSQLVKKNLDLARTTKFQFVYANIPAKTLMLGFDKPVLT